MLKAGRSRCPFFDAHSVVVHLEHGDNPDRLEMGVVVPIWKGKGDTQKCNNYKGVTFLSLPGKVMARILLDRVHQKLLTHQCHEQFGFTPEKFTVDRILQSVSSPSVCVTSALGCWQPMWIFARRPPR